MRQLTLALLLLVIPMPACSCGKEEPPTTRQTPSGPASPGPDGTTPPASATGGQLGESPADATPPATPGRRALLEAESVPYCPLADKPADHEVLRELLLPLNGGWERKTLEARRVESPLGVFAHAQAEYTSPEYPGPLLLAQISDGRGDPRFYTTFELIWKTKLDTAGVAYSHVLIGNQPAVVIESKPKVHTSVSILVEGRYLVDLSCELVPPAEMLRFAEMLDLAKLASLK